MCARHLKRVTNAQRLWHILFAAAAAAHSPHCLPMQFPQHTEVQLMGCCTQASTLVSVVNAYELALRAPPIGC